MDQSNSNTKTSYNGFVVKRIKNNTDSVRLSYRTELRSANISMKTIAVSFIGLAIVMGLEILYKEPAFAFTVSDDGIKK